VITLLVGSTEEQLVQWVNEFHLSFPVLADIRGVGMRWEVDYSRPSQTLIAPGGEIVIRDGDVTKQDIDALLVPTTW
jgi:hypothetical protein